VSHSEGDARCSRRALLVPLFIRSQDDGLLSVSLDFVSKFPSQPCETILANKRVILAFLRPAALTTTKWAAEPPGTVRECLIIPNHCSHSKSRKMANYTG